MIVSPLIIVAVVGRGVGVGDSEVGITVKTVSASEGK
jgi:hypothetical protein